MMLRPIALSFVVWILLLLSSSWCFALLQLVASHSLCSSFDRWLLRLRLWRCRLSTRLPSSASQPRGCRETWTACSTYWVKDTLWGMRRLDRGIVLCECIWWQCGARMKYCCWRGTELPGLAKREFVESSVLADIWWLRWWGWSSCDGRSWMCFLLVINQRAAQDNWRWIDVWVLIA